MSMLKIPQSDNLNDLMYWLEIKNRQGTPRESLWHELLSDSPQIDFELRSQAGHLLSTLLYKRNMMGKKWEKQGFIGLAIIAYEKNVNDLCGGSFPYTRLRILYNKYGLYEKAIATCQSYLSLPKPASGYNKKKRAQFNDQISKISKRVDKKKSPLGIPVVLIDTLEDCGIPEQLLQGRKISSGRGKAKYKMENGEEGTIEELVLEHYYQNGYIGIWSENDYWWIIMSLLFWDIIFYPTPGMFFAAENIPFEKQDMPLDFLEIDFYIRREELFDKLLSGIRDMDESEMDDLIEILERYYNEKKYHPCRAINDWDKYSISDLKLALEVLSPNQLANILERLLFYYGDLRKGLPDLFLIKDNKPLFVECKEQKENVSVWQKSWHKFIKNQMNVPVKICRVQNLE